MTLKCKCVLFWIEVLGNVLLVFQFVYWLLEDDVSSGFDYLVSLLLSHLLQES